MELSELQQLTAWLKASSLHHLELSRPGEHIRLSVSGALPLGPGDACATEACGPSLTQQDAALVLVRTATAGVFRGTHPLRDAPFVTKGSVVRRGDVLGLLKIGLLYAPVLAPMDGTVVELVAVTGNVLGYGAAVLRLHPVPE